MAGVTTFTTIEGAGTGDAEYVSGATTLPPLHRFTVDEYWRMAELGVFSVDDRVELLDGWVFNMSPPGPTHSSIVSHLGILLAKLLPDGWHVRTEQPLQFQSSAPQPDVSIIRGRALDYLKQHPTSHETALLIELSASSLHIDRGLKADIYAAAGIPTYWIVDTQAQQIVVCRDPQLGTVEKAAYYATRQVVDLQGELLFSLDGIELALPVVRLFS